MLWPRGVRVCVYAFTENEHFSVENFVLFLNWSHNWPIQWYDKWGNDYNAYLIYQIDHHGFYGPRATEIVFTLFRYFVFCFCSYADTERMKRNKTVYG